MMETSVNASAGEYKTSCKIITVVLSPFGICMCMLPIPVAKNCVLSAAQTFWGGSMVSNVKN
jgi:hypothetical protein